MHSLRKSDAPLFSPARAVYLEFHKNHLPDIKATVTDTSNKPELGSDSDDAKGQAAIDLDKTLAGLDEIENDGGNETITGGQTFDHVTVKYAVVNHRVSADFSYNAPDNMTKRQKRQVDKLAERVDRKLEGVKEVLREMANEEGGNEKFNTELGKRRADLLSTAESLNEKIKKVNGQKDGESQREKGGDKDRESKKEESGEEDKREWAEGNIKYDTDQAIVDQYQERQDRNRPAAAGRHPQSPFGGGNYEAAMEASVNQSLEFDLRRRRRQWNRAKRTGGETFEKAKKELGEDPNKIFAKRKANRKAAEEIIRKEKRENATGIIPTLLGKRRAKQEAKPSS